MKAVRSKYAYEAAFADGGKIGVRILGNEALPSGKASNDLFKSVPLSGTNSQQLKIAKKCSITNLDWLGENEEHH